MVRTLLLSALLASPVAFVTGPPAQYARAPDLPAAVRAQLTAAYPGEGVTCNDHCSIRQAQCVRS